jgi:hypothetical protein
MAKGISINFLADVKDFLRGTKNVEDELDDVADSLDDVAKDGVKATGKLEEGFNDLRKKAKQTGDDIEKGIGTGTKKGTQQAEAATDVYKKEAIANISEVTSSFNGSWESAADVVQGTLGGVVADLGPVGAALGAAGALGVGLLTAELVKAEEEANRAKERVRQLGLAIIESGESIATLEEINENIKLIVSDADDAPKKFKDIQREAENTGIDVNKLAAAYAGSAKALDAVIKSAQDAYEAEQELVVINGESQKVISEKEIALQGVIQSLIGVQKQATTAKDIEEAYYAIGGPESAQKLEAINNINTAYDDSVGAVQDFINQETGLFDIEAYLNAIDARKQALLDYQENLAKAGLTPEQVSALNAMGIESASVLLAGWESYTPEQKRRTKDALTESASEASGAANDVLSKAFKDPLEAKIEAIADTAGAERALQNLIAVRTADIKVRFKDPFGRDIY